MFLNTLIHVGLGSNDVMQHRAATWAGRCTTGPTAQSSCVPSPSSLSRSWDASSHSHIQLQQPYLVQGLPRSKVSKKSVRNGLLWWSIWMMWRSPFSQLGCILEWNFMFEVTRHPWLFLSGQHWCIKLLHLGRDGSKSSTYYRWFWQENSQLTSFEAASFKGFVHLCPAIALRNELLLQLVRCRRE